MIYHSTAIYRNGIQVKCAQENLEVIDLTLLIFHEEMLPLKFSAPSNVDIMDTT